MDLTDFLLTDLSDLSSFNDQSLKFWSITDRFIFQKGEDQFNFVYLKVLSTVIEFSNSKLLKSFIHFQNVFFCYGVSLKFFDFRKTFIYRETHKTVEQVWHLSILLWTWCFKARRYRGREKILICEHFFFKCSHFFSLF